MEVGEEGDYNYIPTAAASPPQRVSRFGLVVRR